MSRFEKDAHPEPEHLEPQPNGPTHEDADLVLDGPFRRNRWLLTILFGVFLVGIPLTRILDSYRGIILEIRDDEMLVAFELASPEWMAATQAEPGTVVEKKVGNWRPVPVETTPEDEPLVVFWQRYSDAYEGRIIQISAPEQQGDPQPVVIETTNGRRIEWTDVMATTKVGQRVAKTAGTWDPVVVEAPE